MNKKTRQTDQLNRRENGICTLNIVVFQNMKTHKKYKQRGCDCNKQH